MDSFALGAAGALRIDEKFHISALTRADQSDVLLENTYFAIADDKGRVERLDSGCSVQKVKRTFLGATYKLTCENVPAKITATAITPFQWDTDTTLPAVLFSFKIKNTSNKKRSFKFGALVENCSEDALHELIQNTTYGGVILAPASKLSVHMGYLTQCIAMEGNVQTARYIEWSSSDEVFSEMLRCGTMKSAECSFSTERVCAAVMRKVEIPAGESVVIQAAYAWYEPHMELMSEAGEAHRFRLGYAAELGNSKTIANYALENAKDIMLKAELISSRVKTYLRDFISVDNYFKALEHIYISAPLRLEELGNGKMFYINPYGSRFFYVKQKDCLSDVFTNLYVNYTKESLSFQLEHCISPSGKVTELPKTEDGVLHFDNENETGFKKQISVIFYAYRYIVEPDRKISASEWLSLTYVWKNLQSILNVDDDSYLVHDSDGVCDVYETCMYVLAAICMMKLAKHAEENVYVEVFERIALGGMDFIRNHAFNGRFYSAYYPHTCNKQEACSLKQVIPFVIANILGISLADERQIVNALESIYVHNYCDEALEQCGMKLYSDRDIIDSEAEELYMLALIQFKKMNLVSLVRKARHKRDASLEYRYLIPIVEALSESNYFRDVQHLHLGAKGAVLFRGDSLILVEKGKMSDIRLIGAPIRICSITGFEGEVKKVTVGDTEYMFSQTGDAVCLKSAIDLREGEILNINLNK